MFINYKTDSKNLILEIDNFNDHKNNQNLNENLTLKSNLDNICFSFFISINNKINNNIGFLNIKNDDKQIKLFLGISKDNEIFLKLLMSDYRYENIYSESIKEKEELLFYFITINYKELNIYKNGNLEKNIYFGENKFNSLKEKDRININTDIDNFNISKFNFYNKIPETNDLNFKYENLKNQLSERIMSTNLNKEMNNSTLNIKYKSNDLVNELNKKDFVLIYVEKLKYLFEILLNKKEKILTNTEFDNFSIIEIKRFKEELKNLSHNFIWNFKNLTLLSPCILNENDNLYTFNERRNFIKEYFIDKNKEENEKLKEGNVKNIFPIFYIEFSRLALFLKEFYNTNNYKLNLLKIFADESNLTFYIITHKYIKPNKIEKWEKEKIIHDYKDLRNKKYIFNCYVHYDKLFFLMRYFSLNLQENNEIDLKLLNNDDVFEFEEKKKLNIEDQGIDNYMDENLNEILQNNFDIKFKELYLSYKEKFLEKVIIENIEGEISKIILKVNDEDFIYDINNEIVLNNEINQEKYDINKEEFDEIKLGFIKNHLLKFQLINNKQNKVLVDYSKINIDNVNFWITINNDSYKKDFDFINFHNFIIENFKKIFERNQKLIKINIIYTEESINKFDLFFDNDIDSIIFNDNYDKNNELNKEFIIENCNNLVFYLGININKVLEFSIQNKNILKIDTTENLEVIEINKELYNYNKIEEIKEVDEEEENDKDLTNKNSEKKEENMDIEKSEFKFNKEKLDEETYKEHKERLKENFYQIFKNNLQHNNINFYYYDDFIYNIDFNIKNEEDEIFDLRIILEDVENEEEIIEHLFRKEINLKSKKILKLEFILIEFVIVGLNVYENFNGKLIKYDFFLENYDDNNPDMVISLSYKDFENFEYNSEEMNENNNTDECKDIINYESSSKKEDNEKNYNYDEKEEEESEMNLNDLIYPKQFDISNFKNLQLRVDISFCNKEIYTKLKNTINKNKFRLSNYYLKYNELHDNLKLFFENSIMIPNFIKPNKLGEFSVYILGLKSISENFIINMNKKELYYKNSSEILFKRIPKIVNFFDQIFLLIIKFGNFQNLVNVQQNNLEKLLISKPLSLVNLVDIINDEEIMGEDENNRSENFNEDYICSNYGCQKELSKDNKDNCKFHFGKWDFGHLGTNLVETIKNKDLILWKPHWTCCGLNWDDICSKVHKHNLVLKSKFKPLPHGYTFDKIGQCNFYKKNSDRWLFNEKNKNLLYSPEKINSIIKDNIKCKDNENFEEKFIEKDKLAHICDKLKLQLLAITQDLSFHFKYLDVLENKAQSYLDEGEGKIKVEKFLRWWNSDLVSIINLNI